jgi:hypothetical protein
MKNIKRNGPCPCGSGKKYKKCCMLKEDITNLGTFRYEKNLAVRSSTVEKMLNSLSYKCRGAKAKFFGFFLGPVYEFFINSKRIHYLFHQFNKRSN